jgi:integrase
MRPRGVERRLWLFLWAKPRLPGFHSQPARAALEIIALTCVRPGELRAAEWLEFDLDAVAWEIPLGRMKMRKPHRVPLAARVLAILKELRKLTGQGTFLFPSVRSVARCMS